MSAPDIDGPPCPLDADGRVATDLPCVNCGYNLRTLSVEGLCPECAHPVRLSLSGQFLRFASPRWVRQLARGVLLLIIAVGVFAGGRVFVLTPMPGLLPYTTPTGVMSSSFRLLGSLDQFVFWAGMTALVMLALWTLTKPELATPLSAEGRAARRVLRVCACLLSVPLVLSLLTILHSNQAIATVPPPSPVPGPKGPFLVFMGPFVVFKPTFVALAISSGVTSVIAFVVTPLALLRHLSRLMRRVPRPGLVRFCRIEFWGVLASGAALLAGYTWTTVFVVIPKVTAPLTRMPAPAAAPVATVANLTAVPTQPPIGFGFAVAWYSSSVGWRAMVGFAIAGFILLILVQRALSSAAREAAQNAAEAQPVIAQPLERG
ncbi:MAG TPA: hypothetical protein VM487_24075 [Phycisphaerae bacterium]|nr:hypothetical protein [Phycisphaerae bacterium]